MPCHYEAPTSIIMFTTPQLQVSLVVLRCLDFPGLTWRKTFKYAFFLKIICGFVKLELGCYKVVLKRSQVWCVGMTYNSPRNYNILNYLFEKIKNKITSCFFEMVILLRFSFTHTKLA